MLKCLVLCWLSGFSWHRVVKGGYSCQQESDKAIIHQCVLSANFQVGSQIFQNICLQLCMKNSQLFNCSPFHSTEYAIYDVCLGGFLHFGVPTWILFQKGFIQPCFKQQCSSSSNKYSAQPVYLVLVRMKKWLTYLGRGLDGASSIQQTKASYFLKAGSYTRKETSIFNSKSKQAM